MHIVPGAGGGPPDVVRLKEAKSPSIKRHQVRIRVYAAGVNFADSLMVGGTYQVKPPFPFTPRLEAAGEIVETGSAVEWIAGRAAGARGPAQRRRLCRGDRARRRRGG